MNINIVKKQFNGLYNIYSSQKRNVRDFFGSLRVKKFSNSSKKIRTFKDGDLKRVLEIHENGFGKNKNNTQIIKYPKQFRNIFYVYEINGVIVGYLGFYVHLNCKGPHIIQKATAFSVAVCEKQRGKGIFTLLYQESLSELKKNGVQAVYAYVNVNNTSSLAVCDKVGFKIVKRIRHYYGSEDGYKLELILHPTFRDKFFSSSIFLTPHPMIAISWVFAVSSAII